MKDMATYSEAENEADALKLSAMLAAIADCSKPTLAFVNGAAFGGGVGLAACCDIALAISTATFSLSEVKLGLTPATISPYVLRAIGVRAAQRYFLTGERFSAQQAVDMGFIHRAVPGDQLEAAVQEEIDMICLGGPIGAFRNQAGRSGPAGRFRTAVDLMAIPQPTGAAAAMAGESWDFQLWHRDAPATSNFTESRRVLVH